jgi:glycosyltransferase involved in cell wall biosynthesis
MSAGMQAYADELPARLPQVAPDLRFATLTRRASLNLDEQIGLPLRLRRFHPNLVHFLSVYVPLFAPRPYVLTIHDLIHLHFPDHFKRSVRPYYASVVRTVCARAARVITDDERTIGDLERFLGVPPGKVRVIPLGVDARYFEEVAAEPATRPYFLYVGNHRLHKDLPTLFAAWETLPPELDVDLILTGSDDLPAGSARPHRTNGRLSFAGDVSVEELRRLYRRALALVTASLREGFGLPLLEAAVVGTAVIGSVDAIPGSLLPYVEHFTPRDVRALALLMERSARSPGPREEARAFARTQTWDRCAQLTAEVYREVLAENRTG